jgi:hypothetical protein
MRPATLFFFELLASLPLDIICLNRLGVRPL